jgi:hypothetical protein
MLDLSTDSETYRPAALWAAESSEFRAASHTGSAFTQMSQILESGKVGRDYGPTGQKERSFAALAEFNARRSAQLKSTAKPNRKHGKLNTEPNPWGLTDRDLGLLRARLSHDTAKSTCEALGVNVRTLSKAVERVCKAMATLDKGKALASFRAWNEAKE